MKIKRTLFYRLFVALILSSAMLSCDASDTVVKPNVLLIMTDDQGYGDLSSHGNPILKTPHLDALREKSTRMTNYHVSPTCAPTRSALMTGRNPHTTGVWHTIMGRSIMRNEEVTMAEVFKANGYATGFFGKWHLGDNYPSRPQDQGFENVLMNGGGGIVQTPDWFGNDYFDDTYLRNGKPEKKTGFCTDVWFDEAMKFIGESKADGKPFFCYLPTNAAHAPFWAPERYEAMFRDNPDVPNVGFYGMIANIDDNMGRMIEFLDEQGLTDNTLLIFTTDNGSQIGESDGKGFNAGMRGRKVSEYEGGHRVPFFIRWPGGKIEEDRDLGQLTAHIDVLPTLMDLCKVKRSGGGFPMHGKSFAPLLLGFDAAWPERAIVVDSQRMELMQKHKNFSVMSGPWRFVNRTELYDISEDPGQENNVIDKHPEVAARLGEEYENYWKLIEPMNSTYVRIVLGHDAENPARLTAHDWHTNNEPVPWHQRYIRAATESNGFWAVDVAKAGKYRIELRRWPRDEVDLPIHAALPDDPWVSENRLNRPGLAIKPVKARLTIGDIDETVAVKAADKAAVFEVNLEAGPAKLQTWFIDADGTERGAYFCYVERP